MDCADSNAWEQHEVSPSPKGSVSAALGTPNMHTSGTEGSFTRPASPTPQSGRAEAETPPRPSSEDTVPSNARTPSHDIERLRADSHLSSETRPPSFPSEQHPAPESSGSPAKGSPSNAFGSQPRLSAGFERLPYTCHLIACEYDLTRREEEILQLLVRGRTAARIAETLCITTATTRTHLRNIYAKLGVHSQQDVLDMFEDYTSEEKHDRASNAR